MMIFFRHPGDSKDPVSWRVDPVARSVGSQPLAAACPLSAEGRIRLHGGLTRFLLLEGDGSVIFHEVVPSLLAAATGEMKLSREPGSAGNMGYGIFGFGISITTWAPCKSQKKADSWIICHEPTNLNCLMAEVIKSPSYVLVNELIDIERLADKNTGRLREGSGWLAGRWHLYWKMMVQSFSIWWSVVGRSRWRIVVCFHPLAVCEERDEEAEANQVFETLRKIILKFGVVSHFVTSAGEVLHRNVHG
ncbi:hypothetical protein TorRG33x02_119390 [Trema orientale]|uniref:Uncharacterized protein n=1 Tax=Trema orientale TaxID=63057 RepID=A0A2P5F3D0_TREOI|nr:hypothetical protein TorRG33x02_119390 [Trema orientale]